MFGGLVVVYAGNNAVTPTNPGFGTLGNGAVAGIPYSVILLVAVVALGTLLLHRTSFGRSLYATGGSPAASRLAGLNIDLFRLISCVISGGCAALAGVLRVVYLVFTEGHKPASGQSLVRGELCDQAIRLARALAR